MCVSACMFPSRFSTLSLHCYLGSFGGIFMCVFICFILSVGVCVRSPLTFPSQHRSLVNFGGAFICVCVWTVDAMHGRFGGWSLLQNHDFSTSDISLNINGRSMIFRLYVLLTLMKDCVKKRLEKMLPLQCY